MKRILLTIFTVISINSFGQQWSEHQVDSTITVTIPDNFQIVDTLGQRVIKAQVDNGFILITILPNKGPIAINVQNEKELIDYYREFQKGFINTQKGQLIKEEIVEINGLKFLKFSFKAAMGDEQQIRHCLSVFVNDRIYAFNFWELESKTDEMAPLRERLFSSIKLPASLTIKNQMSYSFEGSRSYKVGHLVGQIVGYVLIFGLIILLGIRISKKARRKSTNAQ